MKTNETMDKMTLRLIEESEIKANRFAGRIALVLAAFSALVWCFSMLGIGYSSPKAIATVVYAGLMAMNIVLYLICLKCDGKGSWIGKLVVFATAVSLIPVMVFSVYGMWICVVIPIILSCKYTDGRFVIMTAVLSIVCMVIGQVLAVFAAFYFGYFDIAEVAHIPEGTELTTGESLAQTLLDEGLVTKMDLLAYAAHRLIPQVLIAILVTIIAFRNAQDGKEMLMKQAEILNEKIKTDVRLAEENVLMAENRNRIMRSQIQPHFLFNALATIGALCRKDGKKAHKAVSDFADYLRLNLSSLTRGGTVPFEEELEHTQKYLKLEKLRFGEDLDVRYDIGYDQFGIPLITLQPLVENAILHGICKNENAGWVKISTDIEGDDVVIKVTDNGAGFDTTVLRTKNLQHKGIANVRQRLDSLCNGTLDIDSKPGEGTSVTVRIPLEQEL